MISLFKVCSFQSPSKKNKANGQSAAATPVLTDAMKKRTERFGDVSEVAKSSTANVRRRFSVGLEFVPFNRIF